MNVTKKGPDYNSRLFRRGTARRFYHMARFRYIEDAIKENSIDVEKFLELGCFDGRLLSHIPAPQSYVGVDANVEGGLDLAKSKFTNDSSKQFIESRSPEDLSLFQDNSFTAFAALETCEHINPDQLERYFEQVSRVLNGDALITVPNEKGLIFLIKQVAKFLIRGRGESYSVSEFVNATIGRMDRVKRGEHKGFDYKNLVNQLDKELDVISVTGLPFRWLPPILNLTVAIHARSRKMESNGNA